MRRRLPAGVRMYTGDDFNYAELIAGDAEGHSDALLGIFDAIAPAASAALSALARGGRERVLRHPRADGAAVAAHLQGADAVLQDRAWCSSPISTGLQDHFVMVGGQESARSLVHLAELFRLADRARGAARPGPGGGADEGGAGGAGGRMTLVEGLSINLATVRAQWDMAAGGGGVPAARDRRRSRRGGTRWRRSGWSGRRGWCATTGVRVTGLCRGGFFPAPTAAERARAVGGQPAGGRRGGGARGGLPGHGGGRAAGGVAGHRRGAGDGARRAGGDAALCAGGGGAGGDRAAASGLCGGPVPA